MNGLMTQSRGRGKGEGKTGTKDAGSRFFSILNHFSQLLAGKPADQSPYNGKAVARSLRKDSLSV
jgi:hypothetical protein